MAQVGRLGSKVGSHLALFCIHHVHRVNSRSDSLRDDNSTVNDCPGIIITTIIIILHHRRARYLAIVGRAGLVATLIDRSAVHASLY